MVQVADSYLWPMALAGYAPNNRALVALRDGSHSALGTRWATSIRARVTR